MAYQSVNITEDGNYSLGQVHIARGKQYYSGVMLSGGTFGDGTVTLEISDNGGSNTYPLKDVHGEDITLTVAGQFNFRIFGDGNTNFPQQNLELFVKLDGSTAPNVTVKLFDNR